MRRRTIAAVLALSIPAAYGAVARGEVENSVKNGKHFENDAGDAATWSTQGDLDLTNEFHTAQGANGRSCATCHLPEAGWSINPPQIEALFWETEGTHPLFTCRASADPLAPASCLDANHPNADVSTVEARLASFSMLLKGLFRRGGAPPATRDFDIVAASDPYGFGSTSRFSVFRRPLATANFHVAKNVSWDDNNTRSGQTVPQGLFAQAQNNIQTGQAGTLPANETVDAIVAYESALSFAQVRVPRAGWLGKHGGRGGPELLSEQAFVSGRFNLYDAWIDLANDHGNDDGAKARRAQIARGQELFNTRTRPGGGACLGCHNAENNGSNVNGTTFNVGASDERWASIDGLPTYTVRNRATLAEIRTTDPGKANRTGKWSDMNRFKVPSLRGLAARAPYFHNGLAKDLAGVVRFYEESLGFDFTPEEEEDLVAFMNAL